jgi:hypothetical protein
MNHMSLTRGQNFEEDKKGGTRVPPGKLLEKFPDSIKETLSHWVGIIF